MSVFSGRKKISLPLLVQEMRIHQRSPRPFVIMGVYVVALALIAGFRIAYLNPAQVQMGRSMLADRGGELFLFLSIAQLVMIVFTIPAFSSVAVVTERERRTFDLLALTMLPSSSIIRQKFTSSLLVVVTLIISSIPVSAIAFILGGISPLQAILVYLTLILTVALFGATGILISCFVKNRKSALFGSYLCTVLFVMAPVLMQILSGGNRSGMSISDMALQAPLLLIFFLVVVGGIGALVVFVPVIRYLRKRSERFQQRVNGIILYGAIYIGIIAVISVPAFTEGITKVLFGSGGNMPLAMYVNPFVAVAALMTDWGTRGWSDTTTVVVCTLSFALIFTLLFQFLSVLRFEKLRRS